MTPIHAITPLGAPPAGRSTAAAHVARPQPPPHDAQDDALRQAARGLETGFLSEMLKLAGFAAPRDSFGGGSGEAQFASFLCDAQARAMVARGGIGLAEHLYLSLKERSDGRG